MIKLAYVVVTHSCGDQVRLEASNSTGKFLWFLPAPKLTWLTPQLWKHCPWCGEVLPMELKDVLQLDASG